MNFCLEYFLFWTAVRVYRLQIGKNGWSTSLSCYNILQKIRICGCIVSRKFETTQFEALHFFKINILLPQKIGLFKKHYIRHCFIKNELTTMLFNVSVNSTRGRDGGLEQLARNTSPGSYRSRSAHSKGLFTGNSRRKKEFSFNQRNI